MNVTASTPTTVTFSLLFLRTPLLTTNTAHGTLKAERGDVDARRMTLAG